MFCKAKLSDSSLVPRKLKEHFLQLHEGAEHKNTRTQERKNARTQERKNTMLAGFKVKRARFDEKATLPVLSFAPIKETDPHSIVAPLALFFDHNVANAWFTLCTSKTSRYLS